MVKFPEKGIGQKDLFEKMEQYRTLDMDWRSGRTWSYVYDAGKAADEVGKKAYMSFLSESGLDPTVFPSLTKFETELVAMSAAHVEGDEDVVGNFTSGGTESIMLAVKAARDYYRDKHPEIKEPEMILPVTGHAAFRKAGHYLDVKVVPVPVNTETFKADVDEIRKAITKNTIMLVGSAPSYAHGVIDPIEQIGALALEKDLWFHVDACMGGFLLPYFRRLGEDIPYFGFSIPGVISLSMDLHKYAYCPKNASIILYKNKDYRRYQIYACAQWTGYTVVNNAIQSSKSGGPIAAAWAVVNFLGDEGYLKLAKIKLDITKQVIAGVKKIPELRVLGEPQMCLVCFTSDEVGVFHIIDEMKVRGWYIQPQLEFGGSKENIHLSINPSNQQWVDDLLSDLKDSVEAAKKLETGDLAMSIKESFAEMDPSQFDQDSFSMMLNMAGMNGMDLPDRMAEINEVMNALPVKLREKLLVEFLNQIFAIE